MSEKCGCEARDDDGIIVPCHHIKFCPLHARAAAVEKAAREATKSSVLLEMFDNQLFVAVPHKAINDLRAALALCEEKGKEEV